MSPELCKLIDTIQLPRVSSVKLLYHYNYYDGPLSGICLLDGKRYWFNCEFDGEGSDPRLYIMYKLRWKEFLLELLCHKLFQIFVGCHTDYMLEPNKRIPGKNLRPRWMWCISYKLCQALPRKITLDRKIAYFLR